MSIRASHGASAQYTPVVSEVRPLDELPALNADDTRVGLASVNARGRPFTRGNRAAAGRKPALASAAGIPLDSKDPEYRRCLAWARRYRAQRVKELSIQHGGELSSGVCAILTGASIDMAAARYLSLLGARTADPELLIKASRLQHTARQGELMALDIAEREKPRTSHVETPEQLRARILGR